MLEQKLNKFSASSGLIAHRVNRNQNSLELISSKLDFQFFILFNTFLLKFFKYLNFYLTLQLTLVDEKGKKSAKYPILSNMCNPEVLKHFSYLL